MASKGIETSDTQTKTITQQSFNQSSFFPLSLSLFLIAKLNLKQNAIKIFLHLLSGPTTTSLYCPASQLLLSRQYYSHTSKYKRHHHYSPVIILYVLTYQVDEDEIYWRHRKEDGKLEWSQNSTHLISQLTQCFSTAMVGSRSWIGGLFHRVNIRQNDKFVDYPLTPLEEERLQRLQERLQVPYDETNPDHQESLKALWKCSFPNVCLKGLISDQWKEMGWQGANPSTDFRGCGIISLENLLFFARKYPASFHKLMLKKDGVRATWEYPFAVAGINISFMLIQMLDLCPEGKPRCLPGMNFVKFLGEDEDAFDILFCIAFEMMDAQWLAMHASYMNFNEVLQTTRMQLERELSLEDLNRIQDLPAYNLLY